MTFEITNLDWKEIFDLLNKESTSGITNKDNLKDKISSMLSAKNMKECEEWKKSDGIDYIFKDVLYKSRYKENVDATVLCAAIAGKYTNLAEVILQAGADVDAPSAAEDRALHIAVENDDIEGVNLLADAGACPNKQNKYGSTPLHWVVISENIEIAKRLFEMGADPTLKTGAGRTAEENARGAKSQEFYNIFKELCEKFAQLPDGGLSGVDITHQPQQHNVLLVLM